MFESGRYSRCNLVRKEDTRIDLTTKTSNMQTTIGCLSRIVSRTLVNNVVNGKETCSPGTSQQQSRPLSNAASAQSVAIDEPEVCDSPNDHARLLTAVSGFPKSQGSYNIDHILKVIYSKIWCCWISKIIRCTISRKCLTYNI